MLDQPHGGGPSRAAPSDPGRHCARTTDVSHRQPSGQVGTNNVLVWSQDQVRPLLGRLGPAIALDGTTTAAFPPRSAASLAECQHTSGCFKPPASPHLTATQGRTQNKRVELNHSQRGCILGELAISCVDIRSKYPNLRDWLVPFVLSPTPRIGQNPTIGAASQQRDPWQRPNSKQRRARERETISSPRYPRHGMTVNCFCRFDLSTFTTLRLYEFTQPTTCISIIILHSLTYTTQPAPIFPTPTHQNKTPTPATHPPPPSTPKPTSPPPMAHRLQQCPPTPA